MTSTVTGNPNRDLLILNAIADAQADGKLITADVLSVEHLPSDFDLGENELKGVQAKLAEHDNNITAYVAELIALSFEYDTEQAKAEAAPAPEAPEAEQPDEVHIDDVIASDDPTTLEAATDALAAANEALAQARGHVMSCQQRDRDARDRLATAITEFQTGLIKLTPNELLRDHVRQQNELRRAVAEGRAEPRQQVNRPGPSHVDRIMFGRGHSVNQGYGKKWLGRAAKWNVPSAR